MHRQALKRCRTIRGEIDQRRVEYSYAMILDVGVHAADAVRYIAGILQLIGHLVEEDRNGRDVETRVLRELAHLIEHALSPAHEFTGSQQLGDDGRNKVVSGDNGHLEQDGASPLSIDDDGVVAISEAVEQTDQAETPIGALSNNCCN